MYLNYILINMYQTTNTYIHPYVPSPKFNLISCCFILLSSYILMAISC